MAPASFDPPRCLLVEDEVLIGMDLEASLREAGFDVHWAASTRTASEFLAGADFDVAVLDVTVRSEPCVPLARELKRRRVPFIVYSGHPRDDGLIVFQDAPWLEKPAETKEIITALAGTMGDVGASLSGDALRVPQAASR